MSPSQRSTSTPHDALEFLTDDHRQVQRLFRQFHKLGEDDDARKQEIIRSACAALTVHAQVEEELFYPSIQDEIKQPQLVDEARVEHQSVKQLIEQLQHPSMAQRERDATFKVLTEYVAHHVEEEEDTLFKQVRRAHLDLSALAAAMMDRKHELEAELGMPATASRHSTPSEEPARGAASKRRSPHENAAHEKDEAAVAAHARESSTTSRTTTTDKPKS